MKEILNELFTNPGKKIKTVSIWLFLLGCIGAFICAFAFGRDKWGYLEFWPFIMIVLGGGVSVYVSTLITYGVGTAIEYIQTMANYTLEMKNNTAEIRNNTVNK